MAYQNAVAGALTLAATLGLVTATSGVARAQSADYAPLISARTIQDSTIARTTVSAISKATIGQVRVDLSVADEAGGTIGLSTDVVARGGFADTTQIEAAREAAQEAWSAFEAETPNATPEQRRRAFEAASDPQDDAFDRIEAVRALAAPDLVITDVRLQMLKKNPPTPIVFYRVENQWIGDAEAFQVSAYLSTDALIDPTDVRVSSATIPGLAAGAAYEEIIPLPTPKGVAPGTYILGAFADPQDEVLEMNGAGTAEENNGWAGDAFTVADEPVDTDTDDASASDADPVRRVYEGTSDSESKDSYASDRLASPSDLQERVDDANKLERLAGSNGDLFAKEIPGAGRDALGTDGNSLGIGDPFKEKDPSDQSGFGKGSLGLPLNHRDAQSQRQSQFDALLGDKATKGLGADPLGEDLPGSDAGGMDQLGLDLGSPDDLQGDVKASQDGGLLSSGKAAGDSRLMGGKGRGGRSGKGAKGRSGKVSHPKLTPIPTGSGWVDKIRLEREKALTPIPTDQPKPKPEPKPKPKPKPKPEPKPEEAPPEEANESRCADDMMNCGQSSDPKWAVLAEQQAGEEAEKDRQSLINPGPDGAGTTSNRTFKRVDSKQLMQESLNPYIIPDESSSSSGGSSGVDASDLDPPNSTLVDPPTPGSGSPPPGGGMPGGADGGMPGGSIPTP